MTKVARTGLIIEHYNDDENTGVITIKFREAPKKHWREAYVTPVLALDEEVLTVTFEVYSYKLGSVLLPSWSEALAYAKEIVSQ